MLDKLRGIVYTVNALGDLPELDSPGTEETMKPSLIIEALDEMKGFGLVAKLAMENRGRYRVTMDVMEVWHELGCPDDADAPGVVAAQTLERLGVIL